MIGSDEMAIDKNKFRKATEENLKPYHEEPEPAPVLKAEQKSNGKKLTKRDTHKVYSFWANKEQIEIWKCYQEASNTLEKAEDLGLNAITEYMKNHPLKAEELEMYKLKLKAKGLENSVYK